MEYQEINSRYTIDCVNADFARTLERELAEAQQEAASNARLAAEIRHEAREYAVGLADAAALVLHDAKWLMDAYEQGGSPNGVLDGHGFAERFKRLEAALAANTRSDTSSKPQGTGDAESMLSNIDRTAALKAVWYLAIDLTTMVPRRPHEVSYETGVGVIDLIRDELRIAVDAVGAPDDDYWSDHRPVKPAPRTGAKASGTPANRSPR